MSRSLFFSSLLALASVGFVNAISISQQCQSSLLGIAGSPDAACFNVQGLLPLFTASSNTSLIQPVNNWLVGACAADPCTNDQLAALVTNVTTGCGNDLSSLGFTNEDVPAVISVIQEAYPTVRKIACLKDTTNNTLCATSLLTQIQNSVGILTIDNIIQQVPLVVAGQDQTLAKSIACSDCVKEAYNILIQDEPEFAQSVELQSSFTGLCGSTFTDGSDPSQIAEGTGAAAPTGASTTNGAASHSVLLGLTVSSLAAVSAVFVVLA